MSKSNPNRIPKYRPSLTGEQIGHLINLCRKDSSNESLLIIGVLAQFEHKIKNGGVVPSHIVDVKNPLAVDLGFSDQSPRKEIGLDTLYRKWQDNPAALAVEDLVKLRHYRYLQDLMTPDEEAKYEQEIYGTTHSGDLSKV